MMIVLLQLFYSCGVIQAPHIGGLESRYEELLRNDEEGDLPLISNLLNGHNKKHKFHCDAVRCIPENLLKKDLGRKTTPLVLLENAETMAENKTSMLGDLMEPCQREIHALFGEFFAFLTL